MFERLIMELVTYTPYQPVPMPIWTNYTEEGQIIIELYKYVQVKSNSNNVAIFIFKRKARVEVKTYAYAKSK